MNLKHSVNSSNDTIWVFLQVLVVLWEGVHEYLKLVVVHGLNDELLVMRKEEETTRFTLALARLEHLIPVQFCGQRVLNFLIVNIVNFSDFFELLGGEFVDCDLFVDDEHGLRAHEV